MKLKDWLSIVILAGTIGAAVWFGMQRADLMHTQATLEAHVVDQAWIESLMVTTIIFALVVSFLFFIIVKFRARQGQSVMLFSGNKKIEAAWLITTMLITIGLLIMETRSLYAVRGSDRADLDVQVKAAQFSWEFYYPEQKIFSEELILPKDKRVRFLMTSEDVIHSFWVPQFRLKQDVVPGKVVKLLLTPNKTGEYKLLCSELCGVDHTVMTAPVRVVEQSEFIDTLAAKNW